MIPPAPLNYRKKPRAQFPKAGGAFQISLVPRQWIENRNFARCFAWTLLSQTWFWLTITILAAPSGIPCASVTWLQFRSTSPGQPGLANYPNAVVEAGRWDDDVELGSAAGGVTVQILDEDGPPFRGFSAVRRVCLGGGSEFLPMMKSMRRPRSTAAFFHSISFWWSRALVGPTSLRTTTSLIPGSLLMRSDARCPTFPKFRRRGPTAR